MTKKACSPLTLRPVAASLATLLAVPLVTPTLAHAQGVELNTLKIEERSLDTNPYAEPGAPYKAKKSGDERYKRDLAETPKTISVLTKTQIEDSGYTDLRAILDAQPGITLGTGENGNAFGDRYIIRGQEARSDVFVDGIRDPGMTIRESFATEQVEITKGPDSSFGGRGTSGGAVNSVTKRANTVYDFSQVDVGLGMDKYRRLTLDTNQVLSDTTAVRINALHSYLENPDRSPTDAKRNGLALSGRFEISKDLEIDLDYYALRAKDLPDLGLFYAGASGARTIAWDAPVYAQTEDFLESEIDTITGKVRLQLGDSRYLTNVTRFGTTDNGYLMTGTRQTTVQAFNGVDVDDYNGTYLSTHQGWQEVEYLANSTQLHWPAQLGGQKHDFIFGLEYSDHKVKNGVYSATAQGTSNCEYAGRGGAASSGFCITSPTGYLQNTSGLLNRTVTKGSWDSDWQAKTVSLSAMDTVSLNDKWTVFTGLRYDQSTIKLLTQNANTQAVTGDYTSKDNLWNIHAGLSYAFTPNAITYFSYATASDLNGGESDVGTSSGYGGLIVSDGQAASADPERSESLEVGAKWNLMDKKLLASLAAFQVTKSDVMEGNGYDSAGTYNSGENRVRGLEFGLSGNITPSLSAHAGLAVMKSKVLESATASNVGKRLGNFADQSAAVTLKYKLSPSLSLGGSAKYESDRYVGQPDTAAGDYKLPSYTVVDVFATYKWDRQTTVRLNVANLADKDYLLAGYRSGDFLYKGEGRNAKVTVSYDF